MVRIRFATVLAVLCVLIAPSTPAAQAAACTISWVGGGRTNYWEDVDNWSADHLPSINDDVCIDKSGLLARVTSSVSARTVTIGAHATLLVGPVNVGNAELSVVNWIDNSGTLVVDSVNSGGVSEVAASGALGITNEHDGLINVLRDENGKPGAGRSLVASLTNHGTINVARDLTIAAPAGRPDARVDNDGTIKIAPGVNLNPTVATFIHRGGSLLIGTGSFTYRGTFNEMGGFISGNLPVLTAANLSFSAGGLLSPTTFAVNGGCTLLSDVPQGARIYIETTVEDPADAGLTVAGNFTNNGDIMLSSGIAGGPATLLIPSGATLTNKGLISVMVGAGVGPRTINGSLDNQGTISVEAPVAIASATGAPFTIVSSGVFSLTAPHLSARHVPAAASQPTVLLGDSTTFKLAAGSLDIPALGDFEVRGTFIDDAGTIAHAPPLLREAHLIYGAAPPPATIVMHGGSLDSDIPAHQTLNIEAIDGVAATVNAQHLTNQGSVVLDASGAAAAATLRISPGPLINGPLGIIAVKRGSGGQRRIEATVTNRGTLQIDHDLDVVGTLQNEALVTLGQGATFTLDHAFVQSGGTTTLKPGSTVVVPAGFDIRGGTVGGAGSIQGDVVNAGTLQLAIPSLTGPTTLRALATPSTVTIKGSYTQHPAGTLNEVIAGTTAGTYGRLVVSGAATLDGTLVVSTTSSFVPSDTSVLTMMTAGSRTGTFATVSGIGVDSHSIQLTYEPTAVRFRIVVRRDVFLPLIRR